MNKISLKLMFGITLLQHKDTPNGLFILQVKMAKTGLIYKQLTQAKLSLLLTFEEYVE